jgi:hypothetical protein
MGNRIEKEWQSFKDACFAPNIAKQQCIDLKRTFFGGVAGFIAVTMKSDPKESEEDLLSDIQSELMHFNEDVKAGRA